MFFKYLLSKLSDNKSRTYNITIFIVSLIAIIAAIALISRSYSDLKRLLGFETTEVKLERTKHNLEVQKEITEQYKNNLKFIKKKSEVEYNVSKKTLKKVNELDNNISLLKVTNEKVDSKVIRKLLNDDKPKNTKIKKTTQHKPIEQHKFKVVELDHEATPSIPSDTTTNIKNKKEITPKPVIIVDKIKYFKEGYIDYKKIIKAREIITNITKDKK